METTLQKVEERAKKIKELREKMDTLSFHKKNMKQKLPDPYNIAQNFIMEKGLKLYGGEALHELLEKYNDGLYSSSQLPDYDVFSPNAFEHAKQLADIYHNLGYSYVEVKSSIANDKTHQTYKVGVDFNYMLDITQIGCERHKLKTNKCNNCGSHKNKCLDIFNSIPAVNIETYNPEKNKQQIVRKTYDVQKDKSLYPNQFFICSPTWLKASLYLERSVPFGDPTRIEKIDKRSNLFDKYYELDKALCESSLSGNIKKVEEINKKVNPFLEKAKPLLQKENAIFYGVHAYLFFVKDSAFNNKKEIPASFRVYLQNGKVCASKIADVLMKAFPKENFKVVNNLQYWKGPDYDNISILVKINNKYYELIRITNTSHCMSYVRYNKMNFASVDRMKYILYYSLALEPVLTEIGDDSLRYACLLRDLLEAEKEYYENNPSSSPLDGKHKFRSYVLKCEGKEVNKIIQNLEKREKTKAQLLRKSIYLPNFPTNDVITKISPVDEEKENTSYKPFLKTIEKKQNKLSKKKYKQLLKNSTKKTKKRKPVFSKKRFLGLF